MSEFIRLSQVPFSVRIADDKRSAYLKLLPGSEWENAEARLGDLLAAIHETGVCVNDPYLLRDALPGVLKGHEACIARGQEPEHGEPGEIRCFFEANPAEKAWERAEGETIDFRERDEIANVHPDDLLAELVPPTPGKDGANVLGERIAARPGRPARMVGGQNVRLSEDRQKAYAEIEGCAKRVRSKIQVDHVTIVRGDVDFHTGNVRFSGDVVVTGDVRETFSVEAQGSIRVMGTVDRAELTAGADIIVEGGLYGKEGIHASAEGDLTVGFAENANLRAGGDIYVRSSMVNCSAWAGGSIGFRSVGKSLIGGTIYAAGGVQANSLGNPRIPIRTVVEFGVDPELAQRIRSLRNEHARTTNESERMRIRGELEPLLEEYLKQSKARVAVRHILYPGVVLVSGAATYEAKSEITGMMFYKLEDRNEISMRAYGLTRRQSSSIDNGGAI